MFTCVMSLILNTIDIWIDLWSKMMFSKKNENEMKCSFHVCYNFFIRIRYTLANTMI